MKQSSRRRVRATTLPHLLFTADDVVWLKNTLVPLEVLMSSKPHALPKVQFALETVTRVQEKLAYMIEQQTWDYEVPFDRNEIIILHTAVWLFVVALEQLPDSPEKHKVTSRCLALGSQLAPFVGKIA